MDQLVNDLNSIFAEMFQARIVMTRGEANNNMQPICTVGGSPMYQHGGNEYRLEITVEEKYTTLSLYHAARMGILEPMMGRSSKVVSARVNMQGSAGFTTTITIVTFNIDELISNVRDFKLKSFNQHFDKLMDETLSED